VTLLGLAKHLGRRASRRKSSLLFLFFTSILVLPVILYFVLAYFVAGDPRLLPLAIRNARSVLLVVAHPDDECLFFGPSILNAWGNPSVGRALLVLSSGDYDGLGEVRRKEVKGSCDTLGVSTDRCVVMEHRDLQDNPKKWWDEAIVESMVKRYVDSWHIDLIITFDQGGISGHINHKAVNAGVRKYISENDNHPPAYAVQTKILPRKYSSLIDLIPTSLPFSLRILEALLLPPPSQEAIATIASSNTDNKGSAAVDPYGDKALIVSNWKNYQRTRTAFRQHKSQYSWDRALYLVVNRYMWFNDLRRM